MKLSELLVEGSDLDNLKKNKVALTPEEREQCMKAGAVWHNHPNPKVKAVPAIWKSVDKNGKVTYVCNTHRAAATAPTIKGAIKKFEFIKTTA
jgi:hypothetical protein